MPEVPDRDQLRAWLAGHQDANTRHRERHAAMTADEKLHQISRLMVSAPLFDIFKKHVRLEVQEILGHASILSTYVYTQLPIQKRRRSTQLHITRIVAASAGVPHSPIKK